MQEALHDEIEAIKQVGIPRYLVRNGTLIRSYPQFTIYEFEVDDIITAPDDAPIALQVGNKTFKGSIISSSAFSIILELEYNLGSSIPYAILITSPQYLLERLSDCLNDIYVGSKSISWEILEKLFSYFETKIGEDYSFFLTPNSLSKKINNSQFNAISSVFGSDITIIWGPPGTGKTTTLGLLIDALLNSNKRVLVVAHTNVAVDQAVLKIIEACEGTSRLQEGKILRFGPFVIQDESAKEILNKVSIEGIADILSAKKEAARANLKKRINELETKMHHINEFINLKAKEEYLHKEYIKDESLYKNITKMASTLENDISNIKTRLAELETQLKHLVPKNILEKLTLWIKRYKKIRTIEKLNYQIKSKTLILQNYKKEIESKEKILRKAEMSLEKIRSQLAELMKRMELKFSSIHEASKLRDNITFELEETKKELTISEAEVPDYTAIVKNASVIVTTLAKTFMKPELSNEKFDVVVLDEASMAPLPFIFFVASLCKNKMVIIGDPRQLPPIAQAETEAARQWLRKDIFQYLNIQFNSKRFKVSFLAEQYRMHPCISSIANKIVYDGKLIDKTSFSPIKKSQELFGVSCLVNTEDLMPICNRTEDFSRYNLIHSLFCLLLSKIFELQGLSCEQMGIITPYRAQAKLLKKLFTDFGPEAANCSTVHKFQGREKDLIIFDITDSYPEKLGKLLFGSRESDGGKMLNVAITRPKDVLLILANLSYIHKNAYPNSQLFKIINEIINSGKIIRAFDLFPEEANNVLTGHKFVGRIAFENNKILEIFREQIKEDYLFSLLKNSKFHRIAILPRILSLDQFPINIFSQLSKKDNVKNMIITNRIRNSNLKNMISQKGIDIYDDILDIDLNAFIIDSIISIPHVGKCLDGTPFGVSIYNAENTLEELLKLWHLYNIFKDIKDEYNPIRILESARPSRKCSLCNSQLKVLVSEFGPFFVCTNRECNFKDWIKDDEIEALLPDEAKKCEVCGHKMKVRRSWKRDKKGIPFLACSQFPECKYTKPLSKKKRNKYKSGTKGSIHLQS